MPEAVLSHFHRIITAIKIISELWIGMQELNTAGFSSWGFFPNFVSVCLYRFIKRSLKILWAVLSSSLFIYLHLYNLCLINQSINQLINQSMNLFVICLLFGTQRLVISSTWADFYERRTFTAFVFKTAQGFRDKMGEQFLKIFYSSCSVFYFSQCSWYLVQNPKLTANTHVSTLAV